MNRVLLVHDLMTDAKQTVKLIAKKILGRYREPVIASRVPVRTIKRLMRNNGLATFEQTPSWFYTAYERGDADPLTNYTLEYIRKNVPKDASILVTGCGTGIMLFHLLDAGFNTVHGFDLLDQCVSIANEVAKLGSYRTKIWNGDGLKQPRIDGNYDVILALHWVFSAWCNGNYGNPVVPYEEAKKPETRERLLRELLSRYIGHLNPGGLFVVELTDAVADYRVPTEGGAPGFTPDQIYPVRFTPEQVREVCEPLGMAVDSYSLGVSYGRQPRTVYRLRKS